MEPMTNRARREFNQTFDVYKPVEEMKTLLIWMAYKEKEYGKERDQSIRQKNNKN